LLLRPFLGGLGEGFVVLIELLFEGFRRFLFLEFGLELKE